jgi:hypothetical protein
LRALLQRGRNRAGERHLETIENPGDAERDHDQRVEAQRSRSSRAGISVATIAASDCAGACAVTGILTAIIASFALRAAPFTPTICAPRRSARRAPLPLAAAAP